MRFLRHLGAVTLMVAVVVGLGVAWADFGAGTLVAGPQTRFRQEIVTIQPGTKLPRGAIGTSGGNGNADGHREVRGSAGIQGLKGIQIGSSQPAVFLGLGSMLDPANLPVLRHTVVIEAGVGAAVVLLEVFRRRSRRAWRAAQLAAEERAPDGDPYP